MTTWKKIERSREARLWITQVIAPAAIVSAVVIKNHPEIKPAAKKKYESVKEKVETLFKKK